MWVVRINLMPRVQRRGRVPSIERRIRWGVAPPGRNNSQRQRTARIERRRKKKRSKLSMMANRLLETPEVSLAEAVIALSKMEGRGAIPQQVDQARSPRSPRARTRIT